MLGQILDSSLVFMVFGICYFLGFAIFNKKNNNECTCGLETHDVLVKIHQNILSYNDFVISKITYKIIMTVIGTVVNS